MPAVNQRIASLASRLEDRRREAVGGAGGRVLLEAVMGLDNLDVVIVAELFGDLCRDDAGAEKSINTLGVGRRSCVIGAPMFPTPATSPASRAMFG